MITTCEASEPQAASHPKTAAPGKRIMVVEDDPGLLALYRILLQTRGYRVVTAEDGQAALTAYEREWSDIDLIIAEVCLPKIGGAEMLERMKLNGQLPPVLVCSGAVEYDVEREMRKVGAQWFLPKPLRHRELLGEVERLLDAASAGAS